ncbi:MAG TPA: Fur family transcriptional regulator [Chloroflexota bacterium]|nr:Fur family transcriptional regulator [Chloroflexota bacterium]
MGQLSATLRERGHRLTLQREIILDTLESISGHIAVDDVYRRIHGRFPQVNVSTVYRTLELLEQEGLVTHTHIHDGVAKWHRAEEAQHQHLVCERCGAELALDLQLLEPLAHELRERYGFDAHFAHFAIIGLCSTCRTA